MRVPSTVTPSHRACPFTIFDDASRATLNNPFATGTSLRVTVEEGPDAAVAQAASVQ